MLVHIVYKSLCWSVLRLSYFFRLFVSVKIQLANLLSHMPANTQIWLISANGWPLRGIGCWSLTSVDLSQGKGELILFLCQQQKANEIACTVNLLHSNEVNCNSPEACVCVLGGVLLVWTSILTQLYVGRQWSICFLFDAGKLICSRTFFLDIFWGQNSSLFLLSRFMSKGFIKAL